MRTAIRLFRRME